MSLLSWILVFVGTVVVIGTFTAVVCSVTKAPSDEDGVGLLAMVWTLAAFFFGLLFIVVVPAGVAIDLGEAAVRLAGG